MRRLCPTPGQGPGTGPPLKGAHTHRSGQGGCMLENSGLVLGVDSSLGLLTWLHNPRHVGVALLVHGRLLHLIERDEERGKVETRKKHYKKGKQKPERSRTKNHIIFNDLHIKNFENTLIYCTNFVLLIFRMHVLKQLFPGFEN